MRYTIGSKIVNKKDNSIEVEGYLVCKRLGFEYILSNEKVKELNKENFTTYLYVFDNIEDAVEFTRCLARCFRRDDVWGNKSLKSKKIRTFYPLKIDSSKFELKLKTDFIEKNLTRDIYGNSVYKNGLKSAKKLKLFPIDID